MTDELFAELDLNALIGLSPDEAVSLAEVAGVERVRLRDRSPERSRRGLGPDAGSHEARPGLQGWPGHICHLSDSSVSGNPANYFLDGGG